MFFAVARLKAMINRGLQFMPASGTLSPVEYTYIKCSWVQGLLYIYAYSTAGNP
jgi:hypothetical protein